jgi:hypothetical protein
MNSNSALKRGRFDIVYATASREACGSVYSNLLFYAVLFALGATGIAFPGIVG